MTEHRRRARRGETTKFYQHMRNIGIECFKIVCIKEYTDISKEILHKKEDKYIRRFDMCKEWFKYKCNERILLYARHTKKILQRM